MAQRVMNYKSGIGHDKQLSTLIRLNGLPDMSCKGFRRLCGLLPFSISSAIFAFPVMLLLVSMIKYDWYYSYDEEDYKMEEKLILIPCVLASIETLHQHLYILVYSAGN